MIVYWSSFFLIIFNIVLLFLGWIFLYCILEILKIMSLCLVKILWWMCNFFHLAVNVTWCSPDSPSVVCSSNHSFDYNTFQCYSGPFYSFILLLVIWLFLDSILTKILPFCLYIVFQWLPYIHIHIHIYVTFYTFYLG